MSDQTDTSDLLVNFSPISRSAYDLAASAAVKRGSRELLLSQHYRCHPDIIGFSNMAFYAERLIARTRKSENTDGMLSDGNASVGLVTPFPAQHRGAKQKPDSLCSS